MACVELPSANADSEMEEGEIVDEVDVLSDISSEEEFLLRERLQVLENYNNVLERKEAKRTSIVSDGDDRFAEHRPKISKQPKPLKSYKQKKIRQIEKDHGRIREHRKKTQRYKKKVEIKNVSEGSDNSDDEYRNKRRRLEDAVSLHKIKNDKSSLKDRLTKMLCITKTENHIIDIDNKISNYIPKEVISEICPKIQGDVSINKLEEPVTMTDLTCNGDNLKLSTSDNVDSNVKENKEVTHLSDENSDEDLEMLRQHALKTKAAKAQTNSIPEQISTENKQTVLSEDEDSDTAELRMICLKSALLKKAIEIKMKQKQKLPKRHSQSSNLQDEFEITQIGNDIHSENNTDIESVDMDIGSDAEDKGRGNISDCALENENKVEVSTNTPELKNYKEDELEEDEDLLRAKLLTSLSKNLPNLVDLSILKPNTSITEEKIEKEIEKTETVNIPEEKKFIIQLGESDSEGEHEATQNLTKMHMKLSENTEFQQQLDQFLKSTRMKVEKTKLPDVVQQPSQKPPEKFVAKPLNHLPKSEQIEYRNLAKRMAELEKIKQARQSMMNRNKMVMAKETLKPRNISLDAYKLASAKKLEERIALSRKKIAEESAKMLKLKEEGTKLSQRYKIVQTELRNVTTAITLNKKLQRTVQNGLTKIRLQHQMLIKSSSNKHSSQIISNKNTFDKVYISKLQKENNPSKEEHKNLNILKSVKVSVVNDLNKEVSMPNQRLSVQVDVANNKKVVKLPKSPVKDRSVDINMQNTPNQSTECETDKNSNTPIREQEIERIECVKENETKEPVPADVNDYKSPLDAFECKNWQEDPNAVLCPFEVGGSCRDPDCKYLHPKDPSQQ